MSEYRTALGLLCFTETLYLLSAYTLHELLESGTPPIPDEFFETVEPKNNPKVLHAALANLIGKSSYRITKLNTFLAARYACKDMFVENVKRRLLGQEIQPLAQQFNNYYIFFWKPIKCKADLLLQ